MKILGFNGTIDDVLGVWRRYAEKWGKRRSPWRPSDGDIAIYKKMVNKSNKKILILGATPELRIFASKISDSVVLIDICPEMITSMGRFLKTYEKNKEIHIISNWCSMPFPEESFDIILSDCPWWLLSSKNQKSLVSEIGRILKPDGCMVSRIHLCNPDLIGKNIEHVIQTNIFSKKLQEEEKHKLRETAMLRILDATTNTKTQRFTTLKAVKTIEKLLRSKNINKYEVSFLSDLLSSLRGRVDWSSQTREQIFSIIGEKFLIENEFCSNDYIDSKFFPILKLRKK